MKTSPLPKVSTADSIAILKTRFPGSLVCVDCARLIASTPAGYASSNLTPEQVDGYACHGCRSDNDPARSTEVTARFAASKAAAAGARLRPPLTRGPDRLPDDLLIVLAAEADAGRRVAHDYLGKAAAWAPVTPVFCTHARPAESCIVHAPAKLRTPMTPMPAALARCESCSGWHGTSGRDRCPYNASEAAAVAAWRGLRNPPRTAVYPAKPKNRPVGVTGIQDHNEIRGFQGGVSEVENRDSRFASQLAKAQERISRITGGRPAADKNRLASPPSPSPFVARRNSRNNGRRNVPADV